MSIVDWPEDERPRERLLRKGVSALSDAELLAIFLRVGVRGYSAVDLARLLIQHFGSLNGLFAASAEALQAIPGMGLAKYAQLQAVLEMARRALHESLTECDVLNDSQTVRDWLRLRLAQLPYEVFMALWLDANGRLIAAAELFRGTLGSAAVYPREVVRQAIAHNAAFVMFAHNHPGGTNAPSDADVRLTQHLAEALALIDVKVRDHWIVAANLRPFSFCENGLL